MLQAADYQQTLLHSFTMGGMGLHTAEYGEWHKPWSAPKQAEQLQQTDKRQCGWVLQQLSNTATSWRLHMKGCAAACTNGMVHPVAANPPPAMGAWGQATKHHGGC
jgi:hypothetical protein